MQTGEGLSYLGDTVAHRPHLPVVLGVSVDLLSDGCVLIEQLLCLSQRLRLVFRSNLIGRESLTESSVTFTGRGPLSERFISP